MSTIPTALQASDAAGGIDLGIPVRAVNRSLEPVIWQYDRKTYTLLPGQPTYVPYMAMVYYQGDPRAIDLPTGKLHEQHRRLQREHLRVLYGVYENDERWGQIPLVECYPIDSDTRFETVLADPDGVHLAGETGEATQLNQMRAMMEQQAHQLRILQQAVTQQEQTEAAVAASNTDLTDLDRQATEHVDIAPEHDMVGPAPQRKAPVAKSGRQARDGADVPVTRDGE